MISQSPPLCVEEIIVPIHLEELRAMRDIVPGLLATVRSDVARSIETIRASAQIGDSDAMARAAHGVAGAAGSVGGHRLSALCRQLEQKGRAGDVDDAETLLPAIVTEYEYLCAALEIISCETQ